MKIMIDLLIISYARAEANFADDTMMKAKDFIENMRNIGGNFYSITLTHEKQTFNRC